MTRVLITRSRAQSSSFGEALQAAPDPVVVGPVHEAEQRLLPTVVRELCAR
jgi:hypothetical protein